MPNITRKDLERIAGLNGYIFTDNGAFKALPDDRVFSPEDEYAAVFVLLHNYLLPNSRDVHAVAAYERLSLALGYTHEQMIMLLHMTNAGILTGNYGRDLPVISLFKLKLVDPTWVGVFQELMMVKRVNITNWNLINTVEPSVARFYSGCLVMYYENSYGASVFTYPRINTVINHPKRVELVEVIERLSQKLCLTNDNIDMLIKHKDPKTLEQPFLAAKRQNDAALLAASAADGTSIKIKDTLPGDPPPSKSNTIH